MMNRQPSSTESNDGKSAVRNPQSAFSRAPEPCQAAQRYCAAHNLCGCASLRGFRESRLRRVAGWAERIRYRPRTAARVGNAPIVSRHLPVLSPANHSSPLPFCMPQVCLHCAMQRQSFSSCRCPPIIPRLTLPNGPPASRCCAAKRQDTGR